MADADVQRRAAENTEERREDSASLRALCVSAVRPEFASFTQEWPVPSERQQLSYTIFLLLGRACLHGRGEEETELVAPPDEPEFG
jgi:hypothetical protein